ncbi:nuclear transport factor 2 family protein [Mycobacterium sp. ITM-2016-00317]|uniref:nuclear transport factor 2 family protein n=1 Tax=Mycobacterium sp. ITM-2016-00317 TaxID=2099694 RepID=UPI00287F539D|nr:nuclear transport factor 2 family protein [Mycobacterium sp. ITM-2016-00317]WNG87603.1 nuclear transport factor 2 family protein [Mycobacterium sp. ITM-2016-00317]
MPAASDSDPLVLDRLREAINSGDASRVADCFTADFHAELPHHPERSFTGADRVLANWTAVFTTAPDLTARVLRTARGGAEIWSEWEITGVDTAGAPVTFAGPVIVTTRDGQINWARFYLDPVT